MNERIKELLGQCETKYTYREDGYNYVGHRINAEKFAELIVRECANIAYNTQYKHSPAHTPGDCATAITKHFGVEWMNTHYNDDIEYFRKKYEYALENCEYEAANKYKVLYEVLKEATRAYEEGKISHHIQLLAKKSGWRKGESHDDCRWPVNLI